MITATSMGFFLVFVVFFMVYKMIFIFFLDRNPPFIGPYVRNTIMIRFFPRFSIDIGCFWAAILLAKLTQ